MIAPTADVRAELERRVAEVLYEHSYCYPDSFCECSAYVGAAPHKDHPAHVAAALMPLMTEALAGAWERGHFYCAAEQGDDRCDNPYRVEA